MLPAIRDSTAVMHVDNVLTELSPKAVSRAVTQRSLNAPLTVYPGLLSLTGVSWSAISWIILHAAPGVLVGYGTTVLGVVALCSFFINRFVRKDRLAEEYYDHVHTQNEERMLFILESVNKDKFEQFTSKEWDCQALAKRAVTQIGFVKTKYDGLISIIREKFMPTDRLHRPYVETAHQVYLSLLANLRDVRHNLVSVHTIASDEESAERQTIRRKHIETVKRLLEANEIAMTGIDTLTSDIVDNTSMDAVAARNPESLVDLARLADRQHVMNKLQLKSNT